MGANHDDLIARLENATELDRQLFVDCYVACFGPPATWDDDLYVRLRRFIDADAWTDAARMFMPEPESWCSVAGPEQGWYIAEFEDPETHSASKAGPGAALAAAALKARKGLGWLK